MSLALASFLAKRYLMAEWSVYTILKARNALLSLNTYLGLAP
ncbi:hypothetical protein Tco_0301699, partial [Tanacetum coccineum]